MDDERNSICNNIFSAIQDNMRNSYVPEIFSKSSFEELGAFYYGALIDTVEGATTELINAVVATLKKNSKFEEQEEYYKNLCYILGFKILPKEAYDWVQHKYDDLFVVKWNSIIQKYEAEMDNLGSELFQTKCARDGLKKKEASFSIIRDITEDEEQLYRLCAECNLLRTRKEMLEHAFQYVHSVLGEFCDLQDAAEVDLTIRKTALSFSKEENESIRNSYFDVYQTCLEIFEDDIERDYMLFFKVKIYTAVEKANKKYHEDFYKLKDEEAIEAYKEYLSAIPKIDDLHHWRTTDTSRYSEVLSSLIEKYELVDDLKKLINTSVCLRRRRTILSKSILQYENKEYEIFNNLISILIEGLFADYLKDTTTFARFTRMTIYEVVLEYK